MGPHGEREKISDPGGVRTHVPPEQITVALRTELQGQMGAGRGKWIARQSNFNLVNFYVQLFSFYCCTCMLSSLNKVFFIIIVIISVNIVKK